MRRFVWMKKSHMRNQLALFFLILITATVSIITSFMIIRTRNLLKDYSIDVHSRMIDQTVANIDKSLNTIDHFYQYLLTNRSVRSGLFNSKFGVDPETYDSVQDLRSLMFSLITTNDELESALYISHEGNVVASLSGIIYPDFFQLPRFLEIPSVQGIFRNPEKEVWFVGDTVTTDSIYYLRGIRAIEGGSVLGILCFLIDDNLLLNQISHLSANEGGVSLCDETGYVFLHSNSENEGVFSPLDSELLSRGEPFTVEIDGILYIGQPTINSWFVISEIPTESLYSSIDVIIKWGVLISIVSLLLGALFSFFITTEYTKDLTTLVNAMAISSKGNLESISIHGSNLEFQSLAATYNLMIKNLDKLTINLKREISNKTEIENELLNLNETLESKVNERTVQLEESLKILKETQGHLIEKEKMASLGYLVAGVAHEINTPLGVCITAISHQSTITEEIHQAFINKKGIGVQTFETYLEKSGSLSGIITTNLDRVDRLIRNFKMVSVDQTHEVIKSFNIKDYLEGIMVSLSPEMKGTETFYNGPSDLIIRTYPGYLAQIMTNLVMNSQTHGFKGIEKREIHISVEKDDDKFKILYRDNGCGMDEEVKSRIFEPFYTTARFTGGTGLGMHIVYNLINHQLKGHISCESSPGKGVLFTVVIPL